MIELEMRVLADILSKVKVASNPKTNTKIKVRRPSDDKGENILRPDQTPTPKNTARKVKAINLTKGFTKSRCAFDFSRSELINCSTLSMFGIKSNSYYTDARVRIIILWMLILTCYFSY